MDVKVRRGGREATVEMGDWECESTVKLDGRELNLRDSVNGRECESKV